MTTNQTSLKFVRIDGEKPIRGLKGGIGWKKITFDVFNGRFAGKLDVIIGQNDEHTSSWILKILDDTSDHNHAKVFKGPVIEPFNDGNELINMVKNYARICYAKISEKETTEVSEPIIQMAPNEIKTESEPIWAQSR